MVIRKRYVARTICEQVVKPQLKVIDIIKTVGRTNPSKADETTAQATREGEDPSQ